jgi:hypothetical protein
MRALPIAVMTAALHVALGGFARADRAAIAVSGSASAHARTQVASSFRSALESSGWELPGTPSNADLAKIAACVDHHKKHPWSCIAPIVEGSGIDRVVVVSVMPDAGDTDLVLTASLVVANSDDDDGDLARSRVPCQHCTDALLDQVARGLAKTMLEHAQRFVRTSLAVTTEPHGAAITIDGKDEGAAPVTVATTPGPHEVLVEQAGFVTEKRRVEVVAGTQMSIDIALRAESAPSEHRTWALIVVGAGVGAAAAGAIISLRVDAPPPPAPQPRYLYSGPGLALAAAGVVAAAVGTYLWLHPGSGGPVIAPTSGGGAVGWAIAF